MGPTGSDGTSDRQDRRVPAKTTVSRQDATDRRSMLWKDGRATVLPLRVAHTMRFCPHCAAPLVRRVPAGDTLPRFVCDRCDAIHYQNPKIVAGCIPFWEGRLLLCQRAIEPRSGFWTFPAGFMEMGEGAEQAARRETLEEANAVVEECHLYAVVSMPHISQVYMVFRAELSMPTYSPGIESLSVELFDQDDIPWENLAFPVITRILRQLVEDTTQGRFPVFVADLERG